jgi:hypothetical protein
MKGLALLGAGGHRGSRDGSGRHAGKLRTERAGDDPAQNVDVEALPTRQHTRSHRRPHASVWRYATVPGLKGNDGWAVKFAWELAQTVTRPVRISITNLASGRPLSITINGTYTERSNAPLLDPARPSHPDVPEKPYTHEWGSYVVFPEAGCYRLDAQWPESSWSLVFAFGR